MGAKRQVHKYLYLTSTDQWSTRNLSPLWRAYTRRVRPLKQCCACVDLGRSKNFEDAILRVADWSDDPALLVDLLGWA